MIQHDEVRKALRDRVLQALSPFQGRTVTAGLQAEMADAVARSGVVVWMGADYSAEVDAFSEMAVDRSWSKHFLGVFEPPTVEEIVDEQWLDLMRRGKDPKLIVMREADCRQLLRPTDATGRPRFDRTFRGIPIEIDEDCERPKVLTSDQARRRLLSPRWGDR